jgi:hypothetical protein
VGSQSLSFFGNGGGLVLTFAGQPINFTQTATTPNYNVYGADISAYAGQVGQLLFTVPLGASGGFLDNIQFSTSPIPEPSSFALAGVGGLLLARRFFHRQRARDFMA